MISMIVAMADNRAIGKDNELLWHLPKDFQHFKSVTMGKPIIMGRKTFESIGKPLPGRKNIVITRNNDFAAEGVVVVHSIDAALQESKEFDDVMIIGGASFYQQMLPKVSTLYVTVVHGQFEADAFFPELKSKDWEIIENIKHEADEKHAYPFSFITYRRI
jgi:dihydrofolate reductase